MTKQLQLPIGFKYASLHCGLKASAKKDLSLICADDPCVAAGVYTKNIVRAASIDWNREITPTDNLQAIVVNSGNANACTGELGAKNNFLMAAQMATLLGTAPEQVAVLSTGIIGQQLPMETISTGIATAFDQLGSSADNFQAAAEGILTTDKSTKIASRSFEIDGQPVSILGMAKGAGMIGPHMATMLGVVMTDFQISPERAQQLISSAADASFNRISVEGHMSTNDALVLLASGKWGVGNSIDSESRFESNLNEMCIELARMIPDDGEGSTHLISISVQGTKSDSDADRIARCVASSNLVKTAIAGADPNWGRIVSAAGYSGVEFSPEEINLQINGHPLYRTGQPLEFDAESVSQSIRNSRETMIELVVGNMAGRAEHWTSDLTVDYVRFNSEYTT